MYINGTEEFWAYTKQSIDSFKRFSYCILIYFVHVVEVDPCMPRHVHGSACGSGFSTRVRRVELRWLGLGASTCTRKPRSLVMHIILITVLFEVAWEGSLPTNCVLNSSGARIFS